MGTRPSGGIARWEDCGPGLWGPSGGQSVLSYGRFPAKKSRIQDLEQTRGSCPSRVTWREACLPASDGTFPGHLHGTSRSEGTACLVSSPPSHRIFSFFNQWPHNTGKIRIFCQKKSKCLLAFETLEPGAPVIVLGPL